jgi:predicted glycosyltransferase
VTGPLMDPEQRRTLENLAAPRRDVRLIDHSTELTELIRSAALVVAMAGYNTTAEILAAKKPAILVPRPAPRAEQRLRATLIAALGLAWVVQPEEDLVVRLRVLVQGALAGQRPEGLERRGFDLAGTRRIGDALDALLQSETVSIEAAP